MSLNPEEIVSAQVLLRSATGRSPLEAGAITSENIDEFAPPPAAAAEVADAFRSLGFEVGPLVGISFSITGPAHRFVTVFGVTLCQTGDEGVACLRPGGAADLELPLDKVAVEMVQAVHTVTFTPPDELHTLL